MALRQIESEYSGGEGVAVVGGGLAGLVAALILRRAGVPVRLFEKSARPGGRARSGHSHGFTWNLGAHALYVGGPAAATLRELGIPFAGGLPQTREMGFVFEDRSRDLPGGVGALLAHRDFRWREKLEFLRVYSAALRADLSELRRISVAAWLKARTRSRLVEELLRSLIRVGTYAADLEVLDAASGLAQLRLGTRGVYYLDGGWQTLVDGLLAANAAAGVIFHQGAAVDGLVRDEDGRYTVIAGAESVRASQVILACQPHSAARLLLPFGLPDFTGALWPVRAACWNVALRGPVTGHWLTFDFDRNLYASVHTRFARLGPPEHSMVYLLKYLRHTEDGPHTAGTARVALERLLERLVPDWRDRLVAEQYLPRMTVAHDLPAAERAGRRPSVTVAGVPGVYLAGDWVGERYLLADAAVASAREAVRQVCVALRDRRHAVVA